MTSSELTPPSLFTLLLDFARDRHNFCLAEKLHVVWKPLEILHYHCNLAFCDLQVTVKSSQWCHCTNSHLPASYSFWQINGSRKGKGQKWNFLESSRLWSTSRVPIANEDWESRIRAAARKLESKIDSRIVGWFELWKFVRHFLHVMLVWVSVEREGGRGLFYKIGFRLKPQISLY